MQHAFDEEIAQLGHQDVSFGKVPQRDRQRTDVIVMTMSDRDGVEFFFLDEPVDRQTVAALAFRVRAGVHQQAMPFDFDEPRAGTDVRGGIKVEDSHEPLRKDD